MDNKKNNSLYKFSESSNTYCFVCEHVINLERSILYVIHENDGDWQFLCGENDHTDKNAKIISLEEITGIDYTLNELYEMPLGYKASRKSKNEKWEVFSFTDE